MSLELKKEYIKINHLVQEDFSQTLVEGDIIVPDIKPDILRILQVDGTAAINSKEVQQDKVIINGTVNFNILYTPDVSDGDESLNPLIKSISASTGFVHEVEIKNAKPDMNAQVESDVEHIEFNVLNGRKLNVKAVVSLNCKVVETLTLSAVTDISAEEQIEVLKKNLKAYNVVAETEQEFMIREELAVPSGKPSILDVLKMDVKVTGKDYKLLNNKVVVKGELNICSLYIGDMVDNSIQFMEHGIPFTEIFDIDGVNEDMYCELDYEVQDIYYQTKEDSDGDIRIVGVEVTLKVNARASEKLSIDVIEDAYSPEVDVAMEQQVFNIDQVVDEDREQTTIKEIIDLPADIPEIVQIYNVITKPYISETRLENGKIVVEGVVDTYLLYLSDSQENPIFSYKQEIPFRHDINVSNVEPDMACDVKAEVDHCSYSMNGSSEVEIRCILGIASKVIKTSQVDLITGLELKPYADVQEHKRPSIVIYFVQKEDTLWKIAKKYRTTVQEILAVNKIENAEAIRPGQQLMIPGRQRKCS